MLATGLIKALVFIRKGDQYFVTIVFIQIIFTLLSISIKNAPWRQNVSQFFLGARDLNSSGVPDGVWRWTTGVYIPSSMETTNAFFS